MDGGREQQAPPESQPGKNLIKIPSYQEVFGTGASSSSSKPPSYNPPVATSAAAAASSSSSSSGSFSQAFSFLKSSEFYSPPPPPPPQPTTTPRYLYCPPSLPLLSTCDAGLDSDVPGLLAQADSS
jgi:DNA excision repair protein ERCC-1